MTELDEKSKKELLTCHPDLQRLANAVFPHWPFAVIKGHRNQEEQHQAFITGKSKLDWPNGNHNAIPSNAYDLCPLPVSFDDKPKTKNRIYFFMGFVLAKAIELGINIRLGADWDMDREITDQSFDDLYHVERLGVK